MSLIARGGQLALVLQPSVFQTRQIVQANIASQVTRSSYFSSKHIYTEHEAHHKALSTNAKPSKSIPEMAEQPTTRLAESARMRYRRKQPRPYGTANFWRTLWRTKNDI